MNNLSYRSIVMSSFADELSKEAALGFLKKVFSKEPVKKITAKNFVFDKNESDRLRKLRHSMNPADYKKKQLTDLTRNVNRNVNV